MAAHRRRLHGRTWRRCLATRADRETQAIVDQKDEIIRQDNLIIQGMSEEIRLFQEQTALLKETIRTQSEIIRRGIQ